MEVSEGYTCPLCGNTGPFHVNTFTKPNHGDATVCPDCGYRGLLWDFDDTIHGDKEEDR